ncbi:GntR family transcriptional regulator [Thalassospira marina]|uniref:GntR family transcriptional regulator n=1 Tax=Thalassospira marina TaxID=2048283 RepID=A0ABN5FVY9_9PROT|nr:GntR family transcriptional regulator [Thalassospira marina]AUG55869.1 GntR family transcriptional regulator [Thalassospira marina]
MNTFELPKTSKPVLAPVDVTTVQERVYQSLRLGLLRGEFLPGEQVSIRALANMLGTSAMPVREAIARLIAERAIEQAGPRTLRVAPYLFSEHEAYIRIRMQLEGYAAERAAGAANNAQLVAALNDHNSRMEDALAARDFDTALSGNQAFHFELYRASGYPQLMDLISTLWLRTGPIVASARKDVSLFERIFTSGVRIHADIIDAVKQRDRAAARWAVNLDIRASHLSIRRFYKSLEKGVNNPAE